MWSRSASRVRCMARPCSTATAMSCGRASSGTTVAARRSVPSWRRVHRACVPSPATPPCRASPHPSSFGCASTSRPCSIASTGCCCPRRGCAGNSAANSSTRCPTPRARSGSMSRVATGPTSCSPPAACRGRRCRGSSKATKRPGSCGRNGCGAGASPGRRCWPGAPATTPQVRSESEPSSPATRSSLSAPRACCGRPPPASRRARIAAFTPSATHCRTPGIRWACCSLPRRAFRSGPASPARAKRLCWRRSVSNRSGRPRAGSRPISPASARRTTTRRCAAASLRSTAPPRHRR